MWMQGAAGSHRILSTGWVGVGKSRSGRAPPGCLCPGRNQIPGQRHFLDQYCEFPGSVVPGGGLVIHVRDGGDPGRYCRRLRVPCDYLLSAGGMRWYLRRPACKERCRWAVDDKGCMPVIQQPRPEPWRERPRPRLRLRTATHLPNTRDAFTRTPSSNYGNLPVPAPFPLPFPGPRRASALMGS